MELLARLAFTSGVALAIGAVWIPRTSAGNTTCISKQMDWYTSVVGESPCVTYERLRQICNIDYQVPNFRPDTPGDQCDDQVSACCCNTVAFQLSMLCMNCQYDTADGGTVGIDAGVGAYGLYQKGCSPGTNRSLPQDIQTAVCNKNIRLDNFLYGGWDDGAWFYVFTKENAGRDHAAKNNNTFTHCPNQISPSSTPTPTSTGTSPRSDATTTSSSMSSLRTSSSSSVGPTQSVGHDSTGSSSKQTNTGAIVGGVIGGVGSIVVAVIAILYWRMQRKRKGDAAAGHQYGTHQHSPAMTSATPFIASMGTSGPRTPPSSDPFTSPGNHHAPPSAYTFDPPSTTSPDDSLRHEDGGPVVGLVRSSSGRLPPAYRSWDMRTDVNAGEGTDSQVSRSQTTSPPRSDFLPDPHMPLAPLRRSDVDMKEEMGHSDYSSLQTRTGIERESSPLSRF